MTSVQEAPTAPLAVAKTEAAALLGISVSSLERMMKNGAVPGRIDLGGRVVFRLATLRAWVAASCPDPSGWEDPTLEGR